MIAAQDPLPLVYRKGATPLPFGVQLEGQDIISLEIKRIPQPGQVVTVTVEWPAPTGTVSRTTADGGGLTHDLRLDVIFCPVLPAELDACPAGAVVPYHVSVTDADGVITPYLDGFLQIQG